MNFLELMKVVALGVIEGITEWLPISSTGHMILADEFIHLDVSAEFKSLFLVVIQLGAILAVVTLFFRKLNPFALSKTPKQRGDTVRLWLKVLVGILPSALIGIPFDDQIEALFFGPWPVVVTLIVYGVLFIWLENRNQGRQFAVTDLNQLTYKTALAIGAFQVLSMIPGTSRSGATILGAMLIGCSRYVAAEFSFFLAIPTMFGASLLKLVKFGFDFTTDEWVILVLGMAVAYVVSVLAIKFLMGYIKKHDFKVFGWYRIALGAVLAIYFALIAH
ncbi:undecaprenyl-diphosphate phosphatase [Clostridiaceae bacterium NSJ-31]|uniref:Undecaprenyl-diphosphatase n=1 Tax=Ligaoa zhengdingensis TaxID=2763658 RepID=A0A926DY24_9FIRM|nr:undecaprenyl-diphosphate phosphatase [Ligaoa zhengdingensis]MBC8546916.1 undecaprenyl-diphosphate phosphatase [Ligaoa zhengdingensis]